MRKKRPHYAAEFRRQMVALAPAGRSRAELENAFEPTAQTIRKWVAQADRDEGRRCDCLITPEREELNRLRRENRQLEIERGPFQKQWPGSLGRRTCSRPKVRERESGHRPCGHAVPRAGRLLQWRATIRMRLSS
jgi:transposase